MSFLQALSLGDLNRHPGAFSKKKGSFAMLSQGSLSSARCFSLKGLIHPPLELMNPTSRKDVTAWCSIKFLSAQVGNEVHNSLALLPLVSNAPIPHSCG